MMMKTAMLVVKFRKIDKNQTGGLLTVAVEVAQEIAAKGCEVDHAAQAESVAGVVVGAEAGTRIEAIAEKGEIEGAEVETITAEETGAVIQEVGEEIEVDQGTGINVAVDQEVLGVKEATVEIIGEILSDMTPENMAEGNTVMKDSQIDIPNTQVEVVAGNRIFFREEMIMTTEMRAESTQILSMKTGLYMMHTIIPEKWSDTGAHPETC